MKSPGDQQPYKSSPSCSSSLDDHKIKNEAILNADDDENMSQSVWLFGKYLHTRNQNKNTIEVPHQSPSPETIPPLSSPRRRPKLLPALNHFPAGHRPASLLEQQLLPGLGRSENGSNKTSTMEQLTIFYDGNISVYNNVSAHKAEEIMRVAGENAISAKLFPAVAVSQSRLKNSDGRKPPVGPNKLSSSVSKLRPAGLIPMARRYSLQCFLEKRRGRMIKKSPYALTGVSEKQEEKEQATTNNGSNENHKLSLTPFPSHTFRVFFF